MKTKKPRRMIYRVECANFCGACNDSHSVRRPPRGWHGLTRVRSYADSIRLNPREGEDDFSIMDWNTHTAVCPTCFKAGRDDWGVLDDELLSA